MHDHFTVKLDNLPESCEVRASPRGVCSIHISEWLAVLTAYGKNSSFRSKRVAWYIKSCIEKVHPLVKNDNWLLMKSRVGHVDRGHKFGPGDFPQATAAAVNVKMDSLIIRPKIARTTNVWSMIPQLGWKIVMEFTVETTFHRGSNDWRQIHF